VKSEKFATANKKVKSEKVKSVKFAAAIPASCRDAMYRVRK
jgi:hypothetical protein